MNNHRVIRLLQTMADLLEIRGDNPFRIRAYRRAARSIEMLEESLAELHRREALTDIPGVGRELALKIGRILETGTCDEYENLARELDPEIVQLLSIPGVGPRTARVLHEELQVTGLDDLERLARSGRLAGLRGFGPKTEQSILRGLELVRHGQARMPLGRVLPLAYELIAALRAGAPLERISLVGSTRRFQETVGGLDILCASNKPEQVIGFCAGLDLWAEIPEQGRRHMFACTGDRLRVNLWIVKPEVYGAALCYYTGSKAHVMRLRELAACKGWHFSEKGLLNGARLVAGREEDDIYAALGLPFIPPEIREDGGEIEAGVQGVLPRLVAREDLKGDCHVHSIYSDGSGSLEMIAEQARRMGLEWVAVCDHSHSLKIARGLSIRDLRAKIRAVHAFNELSTGVKLLAGAEVEIDSQGRLDYPDEILAELDLVVAAVHTGFRQDRETMTARLLAAVNHSGVHLIAHPTGRLLGERSPYEVDLEQVMTAAARTGTGLEINAYPKRLDLNDGHCRQAKDRGVKLAIGSDAHLVEQMKFIDLGLATARRGWLTRDHLFNTLSYTQLLAFLGKCHLSDG